MKHNMAYNEFHKFVQES